MLTDEGVKQGLVVVLNAAEINVFVDGFVIAAVLAIRAVCLLQNGLVPRWQQSGEIKINTLLSRESAALVKERRFKQRGARVVNV